MREKDVFNRIKMLHHRLTLIEMFKSQFIEKLGMSGTQQYIDEILEELKELMDLREKIQAQKNKDNEK